MEIAIALYDQFTALDAIGPYEVLGRLPGAEVKFVARVPGEVTSDTGALSIAVRHGFADVPRPEILLVPGGPGDEAACADDTLLAWIRRAHETSTWTTSVCTGSIVMAAAGILDGIDATTHWASFERLAARGARPVHARVVRSGKIVTAAGVASGIDMALELVRLIAGDELAQGLQLGIEYDPQPPFDAGHPSKAPADVVALVTAFFEERRAAS
jgi:putative intracellular protease/amidase